MEGGRGHRPIVADPAESIEPDFTNGLQPPKKLKARAAWYWSEFVQRAPWITDKDRQAAYIWVSLSAEFEKDPAAYPSVKLKLLLSLTSSLGLDPSSRARQTKDDDQKPKSKYAGLMGRRNESSAAAQPEDIDSATR